MMEDRWVLAMKKSGKEQAEADWNARQSRIRVNACLRMDMPLLLDSEDFYIASARGADDAAQFCAEYNATLHRLVATLGLPKWAPGRRRVLPAELPELFRSLEPVADCETRVRSRLVDQVRSQWATRTRRTRAVVYEPARDLVLIGREEVAKRKIWVDVIDIREDVYMSRYDLPRTKQTVWPWD